MVGGSNPPAATIFSVGYGPPLQDFRRRVNPMSTRGDRSAATHASVTPRGEHRRTPPAAGSFGSAAAISIAPMAPPDHHQAFQRRAHQTAPTSGPAQPADGFTPPSGRLHPDNCRLASVPQTGTGSRAGARIRPRGARSAARRQHTHQTASSPVRSPPLDCRRGRAADGARSPWQRRDGRDEYSLPLHSTPKNIIRHPGRR